MANWQPLDLSGLIDKYQAEHVVVRGYLPWEKPSNEIAKAQIASARAKGCSVAMYFWAYHANDPAETIKEANAVMADCGVEGIAWLDCETYVADDIIVDLGPDANWLRAAGEEAKKLGIIVGAYLGLWWLRQYLTDYADFTGWPIWIAQYSGGPTLDDVILPDGWNRTMLMGKQYTDEGGVDQDVFLIRQS